MLRISLICFSFKSESAIIKKLLSFSSILESLPLKSYLVEVSLFTALIAFTSPLKADFGDADFPVGLFKDGPKSYHDGWCRFLKNKCRTATNVKFFDPVTRNDLLARYADCDILFLHLNVFVLNQKNIFS